MKGVLFRRTLALFVLVLLLADIAILGAYSYFGRKTYIDLEMDSLTSVMDSAKGIYEVRDDMFSSRSSFSRSLGFLSSTADVKYYYFYYASGGIEAVTNIAESRRRTCSSPTISTPSPWASHYTGATARSRAALSSCARYSTSTQPSAS